jgi:hypothetical protein
MRRKSVVAVSVLVAAVLLAVVVTFAAARSGSAPRPEITDGNPHGGQQH